MMYAKSVVSVIAIIASVLFLGATATEADMVAYDAAGNTLGVYAGNSSNNVMIIYVPSIDRSVHINISTGDIIGRDIYFQSDDCFVSGIPYVVSEGSYKVIRNGDQLYTGDDNEVPESLQINSVFRSHNSQCEQLVNSRIVVPAHEITLPFSLPVSLPLDLELERRFKVTGR
jgi:hypothetical protein